MNKELESILKKESDPVKAKVLQGFFKTEKGEYGEGDVFLGIIVPKQRKIAKQFLELNLVEIQELLDSEVHEKRMIGLFILISQYKGFCKTKNDLKKKEIFDFYLLNSKKSNINNWDLVDLSAPNIVGNYLLDKDKTLLYDMSKSENLWEKRISIISTFEFIKAGKFDETINITEILLNDKHDLIHKAVGWMLREVGKRDVFVLEKFLKINYKKMPRTMLRYAIEKFSEDKRKRYLRGEI